MADTESRCSRLLEKRKSSLHIAERAAAREPRDERIGFLHPSTTRTRDRHGVTGALIRFSHAGGEHQHVRAPRQDARTLQRGVVTDQRDRLLESGKRRRSLPRQMPGGERDTRQQVGAAPRRRVARQLGERAVQQIGRACGVSEPLIMRVPRQREQRREIHSGNGFGVVDLGPRHHRAVPQPGRLGVRAGDLCCACSVDRGGERLPRLAGQVPVMGDLGELPRPVGGAGGQELRDAPVQRPPLAGQQLVVYHLLHERLSELVPLAIARTHEQLVGQALTQAAVQLVFGQRHQPCEIGVRHAAADRGGAARDRLRILGHAVEARDERVAQRVRQRLGRDQLLGEQRIAL
jgi:hypothetical protein